jgi:hypothetical protein
MSYVLCPNRLGGCYNSEGKTMINQQQKQKENTLNQDNAVVAIYPTQRTRLPKLLSKNYSNPASI